ncbi:very short patch repair endonuclease [Sphingosinicella sp. LY1275]|uniref:very short patch repair endonuclease n=1 Tax=Sphingosinicella sp. LY1275 TaxID=3095379 RepID=UPI002ADEF73D|nr:very short patch repair endonuclease [Sphingosinicella sp. LY1275]MEA1015141.1 very short patch repair endonuclease [Sphingosinicella sp. LY1275]
MDHLDPVQRSANMARVKGKNTKPENQVRRLAHRMGYRFRLHRRDLPGKPDLVFPRAKLAVFVHGCFWHRHENCRRSSTPQTREAFWTAKFDATIKRDVAQRHALEALGWRVLTIWQCELRDELALSKRLEAALAQSRT